MNIAKLSVTDRDAKSSGIYGQVCHTLGGFEEISVFFGFWFNLSPAYGLGNPQRTAIELDSEGGSQESEIHAIPQLNLTGAKVRQWMKFVQKFPPIRSNRYNWLQ